MRKFFTIGISVCFIGVIVGWVFRLWTSSCEKTGPALPPHSFYSFTLTESGARIPCLQAEIEGIEFLAELDMGYDGVLILPKQLLEKLTHKCEAGTALCGSIKGNKFDILPFLKEGDSYGVQLKTN